MSDVRFGERVRSVIRLTRTPAGDLTPEVLYERAADTGKKKGSDLLKPAQRVVKQIAGAQQTAAAKYLQRHAKSNQKQRDGWLVDLPSNVVRSAWAGRKAIKVRRLLLG